MISLFDVEYNLKVYGDNIAKESKEERRLEGIIEGGIMSTVKMCKKIGVSFSDTVKDISKEFNLKEEAENKVKAIR